MTMEPEPLARLLDAHPLPDADGDKDTRGTLVLVAGSESCPGAAILSAIAALRAGAGRVQIITAPEVATAVAIAVPETLVLGWAGGSGDEVVDARLADADAVCIGPGLDRNAVDLADAARGAIDPATPVLLDAGALPAAPDYARDGRRLSIAPNAKEAADLLTAPTVDQGIAAVAAALSARLHVPVAVRATITVLAHGEAAWWTRGALGLGTAGSGDVFAGITAGMLARGLDDAAALAWGVAVHAEAGRQLAGDRRNPGFLARDLLDAIPAAIDALTS